MLSLFEIQKEQKRMATCTSTSTALRSVKPKKEETCKQACRPFSIYVENIKPQKLESQKAAPSGFDIDFAVEYCSFVVCLHVIHNEE